MSAGEKALSMVPLSIVFGTFLCCSVFPQNAIHQFRELCAQAVEYAFEERGLDILGSLMQQRVGEFQGLGQDRRMYRLGVRRQSRHARLRRLGENRNIARVV